MNIIDFLLIQMNETVDKEYLSSIIHFRRYYNDRTITRPSNIQSHFLYPNISLFHLTASRAQICTAALTRNPARCCQRRSAYIHISTTVYATLYSHQSSSLRPLSIITLLLKLDLPSKSKLQHTLQGVLCLVVIYPCRIEEIDSFRQSRAHPIENGWTLDLIWFIDSLIAVSTLSVICKHKVVL